MAQSIQSLPNPNFQMSGMGTIANSVVSRKKIKIPMTNPTTVSGVRGSQAAQQSYIYFDIADNECYINLKNLVFVTEMTFNGWKDVNVPVCFDGSVQSIIASFSIGTSQGLKIEDHSNYSLYASLIETITETPDEKDWSQQHYSVWDKQSDVYRGQNMYTDQTLSVVDDRCLRPGVTYRIHMQICHASLPSKAAYLPLFIFRNGIRFQFNFESVYKAFTVDRGMSMSDAITIPIDNPSTKTEIAGREEDSIENNQYVNFTDAQFPCYAQFFNFFILGGRTALSGTTRPPEPADTPVINTSRNIEGRDYSPPLPDGAHPSLVNYQTLWLRSSVAAMILGKLPACDAATLTYIPVKFYRKRMADGTNEKELVWSGLMARRHYSWVNSGRYEHNAKKDQNALIGVAAGINSDTSTRSLILQCRPNNDNGTFMLRNGITPDNDGTDATDAPWVVGFYLYGDYEGNMAPFNYSSTGDEPAVNALPGLLAYMGNSQYEMQVFPSSAFVADYDSPKSSDRLVYPISSSILHPMGGFLKYAGATDASPNWSYTLNRSELIMDLVKPAADDFARVQAAFTSPTGIPWALDRVLYRKTSLKVSTGVVQVGVNISVRSLRNILICFQDSCFDLEPATSFRYFGNLLTSFLRYGISQAEVVVGGQVYPVYPMLLRGQLQSTDIQNSAHLIELKSMMGNTSSKGMNTAMTLDAQKSDHRLYTAFAPLDFSETDVLQLADALGSGGYVLDADKFIMGFSLKKDDIQSFVTGIDTSQSGAVHINIYFNDNNNRKWPSDRSVDCHTYFVCDEVFTAQNDSNLSRY